MSRLIHDNIAVTIYQIEAQFPKTSSKHYKNKWYIREMSPTDFGEKHPPYNGSWDKSCPIFKEYGANGDCWQRTGEHGFLNEDIARKAIDKVLRFAPKQENVSNWRLVKRHIMVNVETLVQGKAK